jgi:predicted nucleic acid-binding protein
MAALGKRLALDTNVLIDRANKEPFAIHFVQFAQRHGCTLCATYTVLAELDFISTGASATADEQAAASDALTSLRFGWNIEPIDPSDVELDYRKNFVSIATDRGILPSGQINDARIIAETAIAGIGWLMTSDNGILRASQSELDRALDDAGLSRVTAVSPRKMVEMLSAKRG